MKVVHVLRKPCSESTVAANVLRYGTGALNIDASRVSTSDNLNGGAYAANPTERWDGAENWRYKRGEHGNAGDYQQPSGRWPANLVLQHLDGCVQDGTETVAAWTCAPGCPVAGLDAQSGVTKSAVALEVKTSRVKGQFVVNAKSIPGVNQHGDTGGASRFFKQVGGAPKPPTDG